MCSKLTRCLYFQPWTYSVWAILCSCRLARQQNNAHIWDPQLTIQACGCSMRNLFIIVSIFERQYLLNFKFNPNILNIERVHASNDKSELIIFLQRQWMVSIDAFLLFLAEICDKGLWRGEQFLQRLLPCKHAPNEVYTIDLIKANKKDNRIRLLQGFSNIKRMTFEEFLFFKFLYFQTLVNLARLETS